MSGEGGGQSGGADDGTWLRRADGQEGLGVGEAADGRPCGQSRAAGGRKGPAVEGARANGAHWWTVSNPAGRARRSRAMPERAVGHFFIPRE